MASVSETQVVARVRQDLQYPVIFTEDVFGSAGEGSLLAAQVTERCLVVVDGGLVAAQPALLSRIEAFCAAQGVTVLAPVQVVTGGEAAKTDRHVYDHILNTIAACGLDRHSTVLVVGGGAVLDAVGFAAATAHRGVRLVRMPSTVLAQNDAGVGVKNGINWAGQKNFLGCFAPPSAVVIDQALLASLSARDARSGLSEAVKVALIRDAAFFHWLEAQDFVPAEVGTSAVWAEMIRRSAERHLAQITNGGDPFEQGSARPLDCGHWAAHKLESLSHHQLSHGEAVAIGLALDCRYGVLAGITEAGLDEAVYALLQRMGFVLWHEALRNPALLAGLEEFRAHLGGALCVTLPTVCGAAREVHSLSLPVLDQAISWLRERA